MAELRRSLLQRLKNGTDGTPGTGLIVVENVNHPGSTRAVDAGKYEAMRRALLKVLPKKSPGVTLAEALEALRPHLPAASFPQGVQAGWWFKTVQLDLEAKGEIVRERTKPLRIRKGPTRKTQG